MKEMLPTLIVLPIFALMWASLGYYIGQRRGCKVAAFFLGLFGGPIGLLIVLLIDRSTKCPACKSTMASGAWRCASCGYDMLKEFQARHRSA